MLFVFIQIQFYEWIFLESVSGAVPYFLFCFAEWVTQEITSFDTREIPFPWPRPSVSVCCVSGGGASGVGLAGSLPEPALTVLFPIALVFAWEAYDKGSEVHLQADPTKLELLYKSFKVKKEDFKEQQKESILEKVSWSKSRGAMCRRRGHWLHRHWFTLEIHCKEESLLIRRNSSFLPLT